MFDRWAVLYDACTQAGVSHEWADRAEMWQIAAALGKNRPEAEGLTAGQRRAQKIEEEMAAGRLAWLEGDVLSDAEDAELRAMVPDRGGD